MSNTKLIKHEKSKSYESMNMMSNTESKTELKPCPFCGVAPALETVGRDWIRLKTQCDDMCLLHEKEFDYSLSNENKLTLVNDWNKRAPQTNWIPIDDKSQLFDRFEYLVQLDNNEVLCVSYNEENGLFDSESFGSDAFNCKDVLYYQPLPEAKT